VAHAHRQLLVGRAFKATSPNGRFADGARAIDGKPLSRIEVGARRPEHAARQLDSGAARYRGGAVADAATRASDACSVREPVQPAASRGGQPFLAEGGLPAVPVICSASTSLFSTP
jgi:hypothetical protein